MTRLKCALAITTIEAHLMLLRVALLDSNEVDYLKEFEIVKLLVEKLEYESISVDYSHASIGK